MDEVLFYVYSMKAFCQLNNNIELHIWIACFPPIILCSYWIDVNLHLIEVKYPSNSYINSSEIVATAWDHVEIRCQFAV